MSAQQQILAGIKGVVPPTNTVLPVVTGTAAVGQTLSCSTGSWAGTNPSFTYQWQQGTTNISGKTSSTYLVEAAYIGVTLRCVVTATNSAGSASANSASTAVVSPVGQTEYTTAGTYSWTAPSGVTSVSVVVVGAGAANASGGGGLTWVNNISVTPGTSYPIVLRSNVNANSHQPNSFNTNACVANNGGGGGGGGGAGGTSSLAVGAVSFGGGNGGGWGGGGGGYAGAGGDGYGRGNTTNAGTSGSGGGGGGGGNQAFPNNGGGGGVGLLGQGSNGAYPGGGGSGGSSSSAGGTSSVSGSYGGGAVYGGDAVGGSSAVRIIWPGTTRQFPSTNTGNL